MCIAPCALLAAWFPVLLLGASVALLMLVDGGAALWFAPPWVVFVFVAVVEVVDDVASCSSSASSTCLQPGSAVVVLRGQRITGAYRIACEAHAHAAQKVRVASKQVTHNLTVMQWARRHGWLHHRLEEAYTPSAMHFTQGIPKPANSGCA